MDGGDSLMSIKGFRFSLETSLKVKKIHKSQLEARLADVVRQLNAQKEILEGLKEHESRFTSRLETQIAKGINAKELQQKSSYLKVLVEKIDFQILECDRLEGICRDLQKSLISIMNEIDVMEELKDKKLKEYLKEIEKGEERSLEERINYRFSVQGGLRYG